MEDTNKKPPNNSWMLYLHEFFVDKSKQVPIELDLICEFDNDGVFTALFGGHNQHYFKIPVIVGHSYIREIICDPVKHIVNYNITDLNSGITESHELNSNNIKEVEIIFSTFNVHSINDIVFEGADYFSGIEWHNRINDEPFPIRYHSMNSLLQYSKLESNESAYPIYQPYNELTPNKDKSGKQYPITFKNPRVIKGCICYNVKTGTTNKGLEFNF